MSERSESRFNARPWSLFGWAVVLLAIYVLSLGPVLGLADRCGLDWWYPKTKADKFFKATLVVYAPLDWLCESQLIRQPYYAYLSLWWEP